MIMREQGDMRAECRVEWGWETETKTERQRSERSAEFCVGRRRVFLCKRRSGRGAIDMRGRQTATYVILTEQSRAGSFGCAHRARRDPSSKADWGRGEALRKPKAHVMRQCAPPCALSSGRLGGLPQAPSAASTSSANTTNPPPSPSPPRTPASPRSSWRAGLLQAGRGRRATARA